MIPVPPNKMIYEGRKSELMELVEEYHGNLKLVADKANLTVKQVTSFYKSFEDFRKAVDEAKEGFYEIAENKLSELIEKGQFQAINLFFSKSPQARSRGWGESSFVDQTNTNLTATEKEEQVKKMLGLS